MKQLRYYQRECIDSINKNIEKKILRQLVVAATGSGKTLTFCTLDKELREAKKITKTLVLAHRKELIRQARKTFNEINPSLMVGIEQADQHATEDCDVVIASIQSVYDNDKLAKHKFDYIIVDECHHVPSNSYLAILEKVKAFDDKILLGFTATPVRTDNKRVVGEGAVFEREAYNYSLKQGIKDGYLADIVGYQVHTKTDLNSVSVHGGDFSQEQLGKVIVGATNRNEIIFNKWKDIAEGRTTLCFCVDRWHAIEMAGFFTEKGVISAYILGTTPEEKRQEILEKFSRGEITCLFNVEVATEGFDEPRIKCIIMAAPTLSWPRFMQMVGRGTRLYENKDLILLDIVDNTKRHDLCTAPVLLDLPAKMDLGGRKISEVAALVDEAGIAASILTKLRPNNIDELSLILKRVELIKKIVTPPEIESFTKLKWLPMPNGGYSLSAKDTQVKVFTDSIGDIHAQIYKNKKQELNGVTSQGLEAVLPYIEKRLLDSDPSIVTLLSRDSAWNSDPATKGQLSRLTRLGIEHKLMGSLTKGQAAGLIDQAEKSGKVAKPIPHWVYKKK